MTSETRRCMSQYGCGQAKPVDQFEARDLIPGRIEIQCRECKTRNHYYRRHGMTQEHRDALAAEQGGCAVCGTSVPGRRGWVVDHDHSCCGPHRSCTDCRRGIMCHRCNMVLGLVRDDPTLLAALGDYLRGSK